MLITIQFPIVDNRQFVESNTQYLKYPVWPIPKPNKDFVRYFGVIGRRWRGGLTGWLAEDLICEADQAIRFNNNPRCSYHDRRGKKRTFDLGIAFRRFYFGGLAVGKYEVGVYFPTHERYGEVRGNDVEKLITYFLRLPVTIPDPQGNKFHCRLFKAGDYLAHLYLLASSKTNKQKLQPLPKWWVQSCEPIIYFLQDDEDFHFEIPYLGKSISLDSKVCGELSHHYIPINGKSIRFWNYREKVRKRYQGENWDHTRPRYFETETKTKARHLRIYLLRLHAEKECLKQVLRNISRGKILVSRGTTESDNLQRYLNNATKRINRLSMHGEKITETPIGDMARSIEESALPGETDSILATLQNLDIRKNIYNKVEDYLREEATIILGDQYQVQQAASVGPNSQASGVTFNMIWKQTKNDIDLKALSEELELLREVLKGEAVTLEEDVAVGEIASAEAAAKKGDGPAVMKHLADAGEWVLDVATKIGATVVTSIIKAELGI